MGLDKKCISWEEAGLISSEQRESILAFEEQNALIPYRFRGVLAFLLLGVSVVAIGLVALVASNWDGISDGVKLATAFSLLAGFAFGVYHSETRERTIATEVFSSLLSFGVLGTIGLISQVFHTGGELYQALLFWLVLTLPIAMRGRTLFQPAIWSTASVLTYWMWVLDSRPLFGVGVDELMLATPLMLLALTTIAASTLKGFRQKPLFSRAYTYLSIVMTMVSIAFVQVAFVLEEGVDISAVFLLAIAGAASVFIRRDWQMRTKVVWASLIIGSMLMLPFAKILEGSPTEVFQVIGASYFIIATIGFAFFAAWRGWSWLFHLATLTIGVRFLIVYFEVFGALSYTGIGLVFSGLLIIATTLAWHRSKRKLEGLLVEGGAA